MMEARFGQEIAEAAALWVALQQDMDKEVRNVADMLVEGQVREQAEAGESSGSETVEVKNDDDGACSLDGGAGSRSGKCRR